MLLVTINANLKELNTDDIKFMRICSALNISDNVISLLAANKTECMYNWNTAQICYTVQKTGDSMECVCNFSKDRLSAEQLMS